MKKNLKRVTKIFAISITLSTAFSVVAMGNNLPKKLSLVNTGFEKNLSHWAVRPEFKGQVEVVTNPVRSGSKAVKIDATKKLNMPFITQTVGDLDGGAVYQFSVWAKVPSGSPAVTAAVKMEAYGDNGITGGWYGKKKLLADGTWVKISVKQRVSGGTNRATLLLRVFGNGAVVFDDATFKKVGYAPALTVITPLRSVAAPDKKFTRTYELALRESWNKTRLPKLTASFSSLDGAKVTSKFKNIAAVVSSGGSDKRLKVTIHVPKLKPGSYAVQFKNQGKDQTLATVYPAYIFTTLTNRRPKNLTADGIILHNGKPFFPIGIYHAGGKYKLLSQNGFNAVQGIATRNLNAFKTSLDKAQKYGLVVDVPLYWGMQVKKNLQNSLEKIKRFSNYPAILDWKIFDEPHIHAEGGVAIDIPSAYRALKAADPNHPIELTLNSAKTQQFWSNFCDIVQPDIYPLPRSPLTQVSDRTKAAKSIIAPWQNLSVVLQCGWKADLSNQPTAAQARSMVYLALINGAKGIWWYSMHDPGWDLTKTTLWPHIKSINDEIKELSKPLMLGSNIPVEVSNYHVQASAKRYKNKIYLLVTNPTDEKRTVTLDLPSLPDIDEGIFLRNKDKVKVQHSVDKPNTIFLKLRAVQSGTIVFDLPVQ